MTQEEETWLALQEIVSVLPCAERPLVVELYRSALDYALARGRWQISGREQRLEMDKARSSAHNRFIDACNAMSRACDRSNLSQEWRRSWGDGRTGEARRRLGDLACCIAYRLMIAAR